MILENSNANRNIFQKPDSFRHIKLKRTKLHNYWNVTIRHNSIYICSIILYFKLTLKNTELKQNKCKIATPINKQTQINSLQLHTLFSSIED